MKTEFKKGYHPRTEFKKGHCISEETKKDYIVLLKRFFKWFKGKDEIYPEEVSWIKNMFNN